MPANPAAQECVGRLPAVAGGLARLLPGVGAGRGCGVVNGLKPQVVVSADFLTWVILNFPGKCRNQFFLFIFFIFYDRLKTKKYPTSIHSFR